MYIDFHIHAYADEIADRAVQKLKDTASCEAYTNGRTDDTRQKLKEWGVDYGVLLPELSISVAEAMPCAATSCSATIFHLLQKKSVRAKRAVT